MFIRWVLNALVLLLVAQLLPGFDVSSIWSALAAALILGLVNIIIRPILLLLTLPINILTLGLFTFVINALMLWLVSTVVKGFSVDGFGTAFWAAILLWVFSMIIDFLFHRSDKSPGTSHRSHE